MTIITRPGLSRYVIPSDQLRIEQPRIAEEEACTQQPYLLDYGTYTSLQTPVNRTIGREFQVTTDCLCYGLYMKAGASGIVNIRLYHVFLQLLVGSKDGFSVIFDNMVELFFDTPVPVFATETYRIGLIGGGVNTPYYRRTTSDHPDGPITILTSSCTTIGVGDNYMATVLPIVAVGAEPIICA